MAKKKTKVEGEIKTKKEKPVDVIIRDKEGKVDDVEVKTLEAESKTKLEDDKGIGEVISLRFFEFAANPLAFKDHLPTAQELFQAHLKQMEIELWKDEWQVVPEVEPRLMFAKDKSHYRIIIACKPAKGSMMPFGVTPQTLSEIATNKSK